jgi:hypothetical protein
MPGENLLVLLLPDGPEAEMQREIAARAADAPAVHVVAPARMRPLEWLATDEDDARREADVRALEAEWLLAGQADVEAEAGDADPVVAVEDALRRFPADEILIVGEASEDGVLDRSLRRFGLPVTRLGGSPPALSGQELRETTRAIVGGRSKATPFVFFAGVNVALALLAMLITAVGVLVLWLA